MDFIPRPTLAIGDLHGKLDALKGNLEGADALDSNGDWQHPETDLVFLGDAICDRGTDDLEVTALINRLHDQVEAAGGTCTTLVGNHDMHGIRFLGGEPITMIMGSQCAGIRALASPVKTYPEYANPMDIYVDRMQSMVWTKSDEFWKRFVTTAAGQEVLRYCLGLDLFSVQGTTLFTHTPPTQTMLTALVYFPEVLNPTFKTRLATLLRQQEAPTFSMEETINFSSVECFLKADNRKDQVPLPSHPLWAKLRDKGIQRIVFGHDINSEGLWTFGGGMKPKVELLGLDRLYGSDKNRENCSVAWLYPDGRINNGATCRI